MINLDLTTIKAANKGRRELLNKLRGQVSELERTMIGSMAIHQKGDDIDILVLVELSSDTKSVDEIEAPEGWVHGGYHQADGDHTWTSFKKEIDGVPVNILLTKSVEYFENAKKAVATCLFLKAVGQPVPKHIRCGVHQVIMDDSDPYVAASRAREEFPMEFPDDNDEEHF